MKVSKWLGAMVLALVPAVAWGQQNRTLVCTTPMGFSATIDVDYANSSVCDYWGRPACTVWHAQISDRYISWSEGCTNCAPIVIDRVTGIVQWLNGQGTCTAGNSNQQKF